MFPWLSVWHHLESSAGSNVGKSQIDASRTFSFIVEPWTSCLSKNGCPWLADSSYLILRQVWYQPLHRLSYWTFILDPYSYCGTFQLVMEYRCLKVQYCLQHRWTLAWSWEVVASCSDQIWEASQLFCNIRYQLLVLPRSNRFYIFLFSIDVPRAPRNSQVVF